MKTEIVYLDHGNTIDFILKADGDAVDLTEVTDMNLVIGDTLIESDNGETDPITWAKDGYDTGEIRLDLGGQDLTESEHECALVVYDADNTDGIVWGYIPIKFIADPEAAAE